MMHSIILMFGVAASSVAAIAAYLIARDAGKRIYIWIAGILVVLALIQVFLIIKYP
jgi:hypothetical protein